MLTNTEFTLEEIIRALAPGHQAAKDYCQLIQDYNCMRSVLADIGDRAEDRDKKRVERLLARSDSHYDCCNCSKVG